MTTGPDNYDQWLESECSDDRLTKVDAFCAGLVLSFVLGVSVLILTHSDQISPPCTGSQTHACTERLPPR